MGIRCEEVINYKYWPSPSTIAYSPSFDDIAEAFYREDEDLDSGKTKEQLMGEYLTKDPLELLVEWGVLKRNGKFYYLTELGKEAYYKNRKLIKQSQ